MNEAVRKLMELGQADLRAFEINSRLRRIPERLAEARRQLEAEETLLNEVQGPWQQLENEVLDKESTSRVALETIEKFEAHMKQVTNQKEYTAARKQVDEARRLNTRLQDEILERRMKQEELSPQLKERRERAQRVRESFQAEEKVILSEKSLLESDVAGLNAEIKDRLMGIDSGLVARYQRLIKAGRVPAIVPVVASTCHGCRMTLPPQAYNILLSRVEDLHTCPACNRFIYHQAPEEAPPPMENSKPASEVGAG
ncbi:MAG: C4-type zinc ribbon domain-containing protein [Deltaproteobacteria bacterium]|nr:C4-type zinc ribbon domain-containing protein [Deltaproteobacteria bacterium]